MNQEELLQKIKPGYTVAIIPARGGSKSVPKKNIRLFKGHPLIAYTIAAAKLARKVDRVIVSTDSDEIAEISRKYGAEVPFMRPGEYAQDDSPDIDVMRHVVQWFGREEGTVPEYLVHLRVTTPIRSSEVVDWGIEAISRDRNATSLRSGYLCVHPPYKWFIYGDGGYMSPLMPGMTCDEANLPRQGYPKVLVPNSYVDVLKPEFIIRTGLMHGDHMIGFQTDEVPDIDTEEDLYKLSIYPGHRRSLDELLVYLEKFL